MKRLGHRRGGARFAIVAGAAGLWAMMLLAPAIVAASESRVVADGRYEVTIGLEVEPAYEGEPNGLIVRLVELRPATAEAGRSTPISPLTPIPEEATVTPTPVPGAELVVEVAYDDRQALLPLQPTGQDGLFRAVFVPTQPGDYVFRISGLLAGVEINEEFRTRPEGIPPVIGVSEFQFPIDVPVNQGLLDALAEREDEAERARVLGAVGIALGVIGLLAGGLAIVLSRRPPPEAVVTASPEDRPVSPEPRPEDAPERLATED